MAGGFRSLTQNTTSLLDITASRGTGNSALKDGGNLGSGCGGEKDDRRDEWLTDYDEISAEWMIVVCDGDGEIGFDEKAEKTSRQREKRSAAF